MAMILLRGKIREYHRELRRRLGLDRSLAEATPPGLLGHGTQPSRHGRSASITDTSRSGAFAV